MFIRFDGDFSPEYAILIIDWEKNYECWNVQRKFD